MQIQDFIIRVLFITNIKYLSLLERKRNSSGMAIHGSSVLVSLAQLVGTMHNICKVRGSNPRHHQKKNPWIINFYNKMVFKVTPILKTQICASQLKANLQMCCVLYMPIGIAILVIRKDMLWKCTYLWVLITITFDSFYFIFWGFEQINLVLFRCIL
jgi:hypothetical protein